MREFGLTCTIPQWAYGLYGDVGSDMGYAQLCLTTEEFAARYPTQWSELEEYLAELRTPEYGFMTEEDWRNDVSVNPSAEPDECRWFVQEDEHGVRLIFWKWRHDSHSHGELFWVCEDFDPPISPGWSHPDDVDDAGKWLYGFDEEDV